MPRQFAAALLTVIGLAFAGCATDANAPVDLRKVTFAELPGWSSDQASAGFAQFRRECARLATLPPHEALGGADLLGTLAGTPADYAASCAAARAVTVADDAASRRFFETWFAPYAAGKLRLAGYFEPEYAGSLVRGGRYQVPIYGRPADLVTLRAAGGHGAASGRIEDGAVVPYASRAEIDRGALAGRGLEIAWLTDPVDLYFLQVQGSGRIRLPDGRVIRLGYAGKNGQPYVPLGRLMVERGLIGPKYEQAAHIRDWLEDNKDRATALMEANPSYVFFRTLPEIGLDEGAPGTLGVNLAPFRSLAVDRAAIPLGLPVFYGTTDPLTGHKLRALGFAEDTGDDIEGADQADLFVGWGREAASRAGALHNDADIFVLVPRPARPGPAT